MTYNLDLSGDYLVWDNVEALTHRRGSILGGGAETAIDTAKRRAITKKELAASFGAYTGRDLVWLVPQAVLPVGFEIADGDKLLDTDGFTFTVLEAGWNKTKQTWRCICRDLVLVNGLTYLIDVERAALQAD